MEPVDGQLGQDRAQALAQPRVQDRIGAAGALVAAAPGRMAGWNRVRILVVPPRMYSCGWVAGCPRGCQDTPGCGTA